MTNDGAFVLPRNAVLEDSETGARLRVVEIHSASRTVWLFSIDGNGWPFKANLAETEQGFRDGRYKFMPPIRPFKPGKAGRAHTLHEKRYELIDPLVSGENSFAILNNDARRRLIRERAVEKKTSRQYVEKLLKAWWKEGMNFEALAPGFHLCGARGKKRHLGERKVGRPRIYSDNAGINVTLEIRRMMTIAADFYIAGNGKQTITKAFDYLIELFFMTSEKDEQGIPRPKVIEDRPSERQFAYFIDTHYSNRQKRKARIGAAQYELQERPMFGRATQDIQGPGDRFEIDATIADVYLVSEFDHTRIVGRPVIYCSVDAYSGLITGIYIGFEGPSWIGSMMVLTNMATPKVDFCRSYGIEIDEAEWPSHYAPMQILADRAELMSVPLGRNIVEKLRIEIQNTRPRRGDMKAMVERRFGIIQTEFSSFTPGYVRKDFGTRGTRDYRLDAALTLKEFTRHMIYAVLAHNLGKIDGRPLEPGLVSAGKEHTPINLWNWGVANRSGLLHMLSVDEVALNVMPQETATITPRGIKFKGGYYVCEEALGADWFSLPSRRTSDRVDVSYDPRSLETVYLRDERLPNGFALLSLTEPSIGRAGKSLYEVEELEYRAKSVSRASEADLQARRIELNSKAQEVCDVAVARRDATKDFASNSERLSGIRANHLAEKQRQRQEEAFSLAESKPSQSPRASNAEESGVSKQFDTLRKLREARQEACNAKAV